MSSSEHVILFTHRPEPYHDVRPVAKRLLPEVNLQAVGGIAIGAEEPVYEYGLSPEAVLQTHELLLPAGMPGRISAFYRERYASSPDNGEHDCHSFATFVTGAEAQPTISNSRASSYLIERPVFPDKLQPGLHYAIVDNLPSRYRNVEPKHSLIGTDIPGQSLSVFGQGGKLVLAPTEELLDYYQGEYVVSISAHPLAENLAISA